MQKKEKMKSPAAYKQRGKSKSDMLPKSSHSGVTVSTHVNRQQSFKTDLGLDSSSGGERVKVVVRIRPMNEMEQKRQDQFTVEAIDDKHIQCNEANKVFQFNAALSNDNLQEDVFNKWGVHELIDAALEGYSATVFAYGQTGSGKTYTMAGVEDKLGKEGWRPDNNDGLIPRSIRYMWERMTMRKEQFYVQAAFMEIYNEQLRDILNPSTGVLQCRWNAKSGFFVEELMVVECTSPDDLIAVLHEGMKNRKSGSHELNKDSSRSHSILTIYLISETVAEDGHIFKKYGKISFVDLAGSERLKETKSKGVMLKETGNINKSLFTLGKVISWLSDAKKDKNSKHIPYRDSKLTMLLMDSLGGRSKALMIAWVSPSHMYLEETLSTLNYATRTMNIKNKPIVQMDKLEQEIYTLRQEEYKLRLENQWLKNQIYSLNGGKPIELPKQISAVHLPPIRGSDGFQIEIGSGPKSEHIGTGKLGGFGDLSKPPSANSQMGGGRRGASAIDFGGDYSGQQMMQEFDLEIIRLRQENHQLRYQKELAKRDYENVLFENNTLNSKLENLENVFIGSAIQRNPAKSKTNLTSDYATSTLMLENQKLKKKLEHVEHERLEISRTVQAFQEQAPVMGSHAFDVVHDENELMKLEDKNKKLKRQLEFMQKRERELLGQLNKPL